MHNNFSFPNPSSIKKGGFGKENFFVSPTFD